MQSKKSNLDLDMVEKIETDLNVFFERNEPYSGKVNFLKENVRMAEHSLRLPMKQYIFEQNCRIHEYKAHEA